MEKKEIKKNYFSSLVIDPVKTFYDYLRLNFDSYYNEYLNEEFNFNSFSSQRVSKVENKISENNAQLRKAYVDLEVKKNRIYSVLIGLSFFILIGLLFIMIFFNARDKLKEYKEIKNRIEGNNIQLQNQIFSLNLTAFGTFNALDFLKKYLEDCGIREFKILSDDSVIESIKKFHNQQSKFVKSYDRSHNIVDIRGVECLIRANPYYDLLVRELAIMDIQTQMTQTFPYSAVEEVMNSEGKIEIRHVTKYETLTAYHYEPTPFVLENNVVMLKTNFSEDLIFFTNAKKNKDVIKLENKQFSDTFRIYGANNLIALNSFFTIKAQEDYLNWAKSKGHYNFCKINKDMIIDITKNGKSYPCDNVNFLDILPLSKKSVLSLVPPDNNQTLNDIKKIVKNELLSYIDKFSETALMFLFSPMISREFYRENGNYLILDNIENKVEEISITPKNISVNNLISKFSDESYFKFSSKQNSKPFWLEKNSITKVTHPSLSNLYKASFDLHSYWSKEKVDMVTVCGIHVGVKIIPVPYEEFYPMKECKEILFLAKNNKMKTKILIGNNKEVIDTYFNDNSDTKFFQKNNIWTNNPESLIDNMKENEEFKNIISTFNNIVTNDLKNDKSICRIYMDDEGIYLTSNSKLTETIQNKFINVLNILSTLNFK
ncbi:MAG: hypothetical protein RSA40_02830 [Malacoplasma sp.]